MDQKPEVKIDPEDKKTGKTRSQPRFRLAMVLAVALLLVTCAVAAGGLRVYYGGKCGHKFTIKASVNGQTFTEEVKVDRENGMVVYRDDVSTEDGEIIQTKQGVSVLYHRGSCYVLEDENNNQTTDIDVVEAATESLANADDVPSFDLDQVVFLNRSVPVSPEDDVILRSQLPPVCRDAALYRVQEEDARDYWGQEMDSEESTETPYKSRVRRRIRIGPCRNDRPDVAAIIGFDIIYGRSCSTCSGGPPVCPQTFTCYDHCNCIKGRAWGCMYTHNTPA